MIKKIRVEDAVGYPLLHDITAIMPDGFKGVKYKRGHVVSREDINGLKDIGKDHIYIGELEADQVHEEDAISALAPYLAGPNTEASPVSEGKITLKSKVRGLFVINREALRAINASGDYTVTCIRSYTKVESGAKLCGARIVPLWTSRDKVDRALEIGKNAGCVFEVRPYRELKVACIITGDEVYYGRIKDAFKPVLEAKLKEFPANVLGYSFCPDDIGKIVEEFQKYKDLGADLVLFTGGMSVDPDDTTPSAIRETGSRVIVQGITMQPGNMLMIAKLDGTYLMGVPGASIHSKVTSFDYFLPRIFAGLDLKKDDFLEMAEGGLL